MQNDRDEDLKRFLGSIAQPSEERLPDTQSQSATSGVARSGEQVDAARQVVSQPETPPAAAVPSSEIPTITEQLRATGIVSEGVLRDAQEAVKFTSQAAGPGAAESPDLALVNELVRRDALTTWQAKLIRAGRAEQLLLDNGRYILVDELGRGGMGAVYRARHTRMNREAALKVIDPRRVQSKDAAKRFRRELEVSAKLQHEHIVQAFDVSEHKGVSFLVLEYVHGSDLASLVKRDGPMAPDEAAAIAMQAAAGLAYAHSQGVVHRDIKPQNILLSTAGVTKILDMGLARVLDETVVEGQSSMTQEGAIMGTVDYMPPEQAHDAHAADGRSDIYSLGATLYHLLVGRPPFAGGMAIDKLRRLALEEPEPIGQLRPDCPIELAQVVERMMQKRPEDRYETAEEVVRALEPLAAEQIHGRQVVTTSVQTAAATHRESDGAMPDELLALRDVSVSEMLSRNRHQAKSPLTAWLVAGGAALLSVLAIGGWWIARDRDGSKLAGQGQSALESSPKSGPQPPSGFRIDWPAHYAGVWSVAWSPDGKELASGGGEGTVRIWDASRVQQSRLAYDGHFSAVHMLAWSPDGQWLASADWLGEIRVWSRAGGKERTKIKRERLIEQNGLYALTFSPDSRELAFASKSNQVVRWDLEKNSAIWSEPFIAWRLCYSHNGEFLAATGPDRQATVWPLKSQQAPIQLPVETGMRLLSFAADDKLISAQKEKIELWDVRSGEKKQEFQLGQNTVTFGDANWNFPHILFSAAGDRGLVVATDELLMMDLREGTLSRTASSPESRAYLNRAVTTYLPSPQLDRIVGRSNEGKGMFTLSVASGRASEPFGYGGWLAQDTRPEILGGTVLRRWHDSRQLTASWDLASGKSIASFPVEPCAVESDGRVRSAVENRIQTTYFTDADNRPRVAPVKLEDAESYVDRRWSTTGQFVIGYGPRQRGDPELLKNPARCRIWDSASGAIVRTVQIGPFDYSGPSLSRDGDVLAVGFDGRPEITNSRTDAKIRVWRGDSPEPAVEISTGFGNYVTAIVLAPNGKLIATPFDAACDPIQIWSAENGKRLATFAINLTSVDAFTPWLEFSPSSRYLFAVRQIWDLKDPSAPEMVWECPESAHAVGNARWFPSGAFFPNERYVVISQDAQFQVWDWKEKNKSKQKKLTLYFLPDSEWAMVNHTTGHWSGSPLAGQHLRLLQTDASGKREWLSPVKFQDRTGFKPDAKKAGLEFPLK